MNSSHAFRSGYSRSMSRRWLTQFIYLGASIILLAVTAYVAFAGSTGQIQGRVTERKDSVLAGLIGVSVQVVGTNRGAVTDKHGDFLIRGLNIGTYQLHISAAGYQTILLTALAVKADQITITSATLTIADADQETDPIVVKDKKDIITKTNVERKVALSEKGQLKKPASRVDDVLKSQAGVSISRSGQTSIRGGRAGECGYVMDGVPLSDGLGGTSALPNTERYADIVENDFHRALTSPLSTFSIDVDAASYSNVRRFLNDRSLPPSNAVRTEELINYFDYDYPNPIGEDPFSITTELGDCPWNRSHQLVHIGTQGRRMENRSLPPNNLVFLIDVSGSMDQPDKLPLVKESMRLLVHELRSVDRVSIVVYAGNAGLVLEATSGDNKQAIVNAIDRLEAGGSTAGGAGIELAYAIARRQFMKEGNNRVILATDGDFNVGVSSEKGLEQLIEEKRDAGIFLTVLGFGTGNIQDSKMEILADKGNGNYAYIDNLLEGKKALVTEMSGTLLTLAEDVKIQIEFNPARVEAYRLVGYENRTLAPEDFNNDRKDAGELGAGHSVTALYEIVPIGGQWTQGVDPLRYQVQNVSSVMPPHPDRENLTNELMTVKFRYKEPNGCQSKLIVRTVRADQDKSGDHSDNFNFSAAVAEYGMLLSGSSHKGESSWKDVIALAKSSLGHDEEGYRHEFVRLAEMAQLLSRD